MWHARGDDASRVSPRRASRPRSRRRRTPPPPPEHATLFLFVHDPPDRPSRSSPRRAVRESHPTDPLPSHATPLRPVLKTRVRSWTAGRGHDFAVPATRDPISGKFFAALDAPGSDPALVAWGDGDPVASLDALIGGSTARLVGGVAALAPAGNVREGVLADAARRALVRTGCAQARRLRRRRARLRRGGGGARAEGEGVWCPRRAETEQSEEGRRGRARPAGRASRRCAASGERRRRAARRARGAWTRPPAFASGGRRRAVTRRQSRAAAAEGDELILVSRAATGRRTTRTRRTGAPVRARLGGGGAARRAPAASGRGGARRTSESGALARLGGVLGGGYFAVARARGRRERHRARRACGGVRAPGVAAGAGGGVSVRSRRRRRIVPLARVSPTRSRSWSSRPPPCRSRPRSAR